MARVICTLPNASAKISGVTFIADKGQMISEEISDPVAENFASIKGYILVPAPVAPKTPAKGAAPSDPAATK